MPTGIYKRTKPVWNKGKKGWTSSGSFTKDTFNSDFLSERMKGSKNPNWKGGIAGKFDSFRHSREYKIWRMSVFQKDRFTCVFCGYKSKGVRPPDIHADHIKSFGDYPELRLAIDNGRTLCIDCHRKTETWGFRKNIKKK